jgi:hypothetical protein
MISSKKLLTCLAAALAVGAIATPAAPAATTIGNQCVGNTTSLVTAVQLSQAATAFPLVAPVGGVITKWGTSVVPYGGGLSQKLKVMRPTGPANTFQVVGESALEPVVSGVNSYSTRIPVQAGDRLGGFGTPSTLLCSGATSTDVVGQVAGDQALNSTLAYPPVEKVQLPATATIEPDADKDGFGDETQDKCPQSAALQIACPTLTLEAAALSPAKGSVRVLVASGLETNITVSASAKISGKKGKAKSSAVTTLAPITQLVKPGQLAHFTMNFTRALKQELAALSTKKSVKLTVTATGTDPAGRVSSYTLTVKLKGQKKPKPK